MSESFNMWFKKWGGVFAGFGIAASLVGTLNGNPIAAVILLINIASLVAWVNLNKDGGK